MAVGWAGRLGTMKSLSHRDDLSALLERVGRLTPEDKGLWGMMTVHEMVCHLRDAYEGALGLRVVADAPAPPVPRPLFKWFALHVPVRWPPGVKTPPEVDQKIGGTRPGEFASDVESLLTRMEEFARCESAIPKHPIFGRMSGREWMRWGYLHADHHLRQFGR